MPNKSRASRRRPRTSKTYDRKLEKIKKWYFKREKARKGWSPEKLKKAKPLKPLEFYIENLRKLGNVETKKSYKTTLSRTKPAWY